MLNTNPTWLYKVGGSLAFNHPTYVARQADHELLAALQAGKFCYVFNCRQMGKSSLRVRAMHQLQAEGKDCASIDITSLGSDIDQQQWYNGIITQLFLSFNFVGKVNLKVWLRERSHLSPVQKLSQFIEEIVLSQAKGEQVFIFIDEIDKVLSLKFSLDDFFSLIRFCYNQRAENAAYNRLSFALFGVATPSDLIRDKTQTPFNIGQAIALTGFTETEVEPLALGLAHLAKNPQKLLSVILNWTGGQPFLTQKVCALLCEKGEIIVEGREVITVETLIDQQLIHHWESQDEPVHLKTIRDRLLRNEQKTGRLLGLYQQILEKGFIQADDSPEQSELRLSGIVVKNDGQLVPYNRIYQAVFSLDWVHRELAKIRPYSEAILAWQASNYEDQSRLLRGQALKDALRWSANKNLSNLDYKFLNASQNLEQAEAEQTNLILQKANQKAQRMIQFGVGILTLSLLGSVIAIFQANLASQKQQQAQIGTELQRIGESAERQFNFEQINGLLSVMQTGQDLKKLVNSNEVLSHYPATSPLLSLQKILDHIQEHNILQGHQESVSSVAFSPNNQILASASGDKIVRLWHLNGKLQKSLLGHQGAVYRVSFSPDGQTLATASQDETVKLWNLAGQELKTLRGHQGSVYAVTFSPDGRYLASSSRDKTARLWNREGQTLAVLKNHGRSVDDVKFSPDSQHLVTVSRDGFIRLWDLQGHLLKRFGLPNIAFFSVNFSPDGQMLAVAGDDGNSYLWNLEGQLLATFKGNQESVLSVIFSPDGQRLISSGSDGTTKIWSRSGLELATLRGHQEAVFSVAMTGNGKTLATASEDGTVKLWDLTPKTTLGSRLATARLTGFAFNPVQSEIAITTTEEAPKLFNLQGQLQRTFPAQVQDFSSLGLAQLNFSADGQYLMGNAGGGNIQIWDRQGKLVSHFQAAMGRIYDLQMNADNTVIAIANRQGEIWLWEWQKHQQPPRLLRTIKADSDRLRSVSFNPQAPQLASASDTGIVKIWNLQGQLETHFQAATDLIYQVQFSPTGKYLLTASRDGTAKLWTRQGTHLQTLKTDPLPIQKISFSPQEQWIAIASSDGTIRLWDLAGNLRGEFKGKETAIVLLGFTSDSRSIVTLNQEGTLREWPVEKELNRLERLLKTGCQWLGDYLQSHPQEQEKLPICQQLKI